MQIKQEKITRYFVAVNEVGKVAAARMDSPANQTPTRVIQAEIAAVIENWRTVTVDTELQKRMIANLTAHTAGAAKGVLKQWYGQNNPFEIAKGGKLINVEIGSLPLPVSQGSYRVEWVEIVRNHQGVELERNHYEAITTVDLIPPQDEATMLKNPGGVYITNLSASKIIK
jgi:type IV secretion system protein VirB5